MSRKNRDEAVVLCVDDEKPVLASLRRLLRDEPYRLVCIDKPRRALDLVRRHPVDLLVTDQRMPGMTGVDLVRAVQEASPETVCMVLTAFPDVAVILDRASLRIQKLLTKPWEGAHLKASIRELLGCGLFPAPADRIDCRGRTVADVLERVLHACASPDPAAPPPLIVLENLVELADSISSLLKKLAGIVADRDLRVTLDDASGHVATFVGLIGGGEQLRVVEGKREPVAWMGR